MTKAEIANVIRDFTLDLEQQMGLNTMKVIAEMRAFAERVENDDKLPPDTLMYTHGEER